MPYRRSRQDREAVRLEAAADTVIAGKEEAAHDATATVIEAQNGTAARVRINGLAYGGGKMRVPGWSQPVVVDLSGGTIPESVPLLTNHENRTGARVGMVKGRTDGKSLSIDGEILSSSGAAKGIVEQAEAGADWQLSIGTEVDDWELVQTSRVVNGQEQQGPFYHIKKWTLREVSVIPVGADTSSRMKLAAEFDLHGGPEMTFEEWLKKHKIEVEGLGDERRTELKAAFDAGKEPPKAEHDGKGGNPERVVHAANVDAELAETRRRAAIEDMAVLAMREHRGDVQTCERIRDLMAQAQDAQTSLREFELMLDRGSRPLVDDHAGIYSRDNAAVLSAAALISGGLGEELAVKELGSRTVETARKQFGRDMGLQEIILAAAHINGYSGRNRVTVGNWREAWAYASGTITAAGYSTVNLPNILGNVANKAAAKVAGEPTWISPRIAGVANHSNFHAHTVCSMAANGTLESVGPGGELKNLSLSEETYTRQVGTRGAVLRLSRTDIINDDLGMFTRNAENLVRKGYNAREKALFTLINASGAGAAHFTAARANYITGTTVASVEDMAAAIKAFRLLEGTDGEPISVDPALVLCGPSNESGFGILLGQYPAVVVTGVGNSAKRAGGTNIYAGKFGGAPLVSPWIEKTSAGGTAAGTAWYLLADPGILPCYEIAYLNGVGSPTVEYFGLDQDADSLGVAWRIYWDFGVAAAEWRAGVKSAGA